MQCLLAPCTARRDWPCRATALWHATVEHTDCHGRHCCGCQGASPCLMAQVFCSLLVVHQQHGLMGGLRPAQC